MIKRLLNWLRSFFVKEDFDEEDFDEEGFDVEEFSKNAEKELKEKLKIIYKSKEYKKSKKEIYKYYGEFKEENNKLIGKIFEHNEVGFFKIIKVKEPWFLKSPILIDSANFKWKFEEVFDIRPFDGLYIEEISLDEIEKNCVECSRENYKKYIERNLKEFA